MVHAPKEQHPLFFQRSPLSLYGELAPCLARAGCRLARSVRAIHVRARRLQCGSTQAR